MLGVDFSDQLQCARVGLTFSDSSGSLFLDSSAFSALSSSTFIMSTMGQACLNRIKAVLTASRQHDLDLSSRNSLRVEGKLIGENQDYSATVATTMHSPPCAVISLHGWRLLSNCVATPGTCMACSVL